MNDVALKEASVWAQQLMDAEWKGRRDREKSVRHRLAKNLGVKESYLFRLQYKISEMNDVRGSVYRALQLGRYAYGIVADAGEAAYEKEKALANARNSKLVGLADVVSGPKTARSMK